MRVEHPLLRFRLAFILLAIVIVVGVAGYMLIDGWNLADSFYMVITDHRDGRLRRDPPAGRARPRLHIGADRVRRGDGSLQLRRLRADAVRQCMGRIPEGKEVAGRSRPLARALHHLRLRPHRTQIVAEFESHQVPYVVIDQTEEALERIRSEGRLHIEGDASKEEILKQAGIGRARGLISAVDSDERAVYIVLAARALNPSIYIVARAGRPESIRRLELAGATRTISPYLMAGHRMAELAIRPAMVDVLEGLHHGEAGIGVEEMVVAGGTSVAGHTLEESGLLAADAARVLAVRKRDGTVSVNPASTVTLEDGDLVIALGTEDQLFASAAKLR
jgi:voltage-gated potassium channel